MSMNSARENGAILVCEKINWGQIARDTGKWLQTTWIIYDDGAVISKTMYDSNRFTNREARIHTQEFVLSQEDFTTLKSWLNDVFPSSTLSTGYDGVGWKITSFDENGKVALSKKGYVYFNQSFDVLLNILGEKSV